MKRKIVLILSVTALIIMFSILSSKKLQLSDNSFDRKTDGLNVAKQSEIIKLASGDSLKLTADVVKKNILGKEIRMFGYNEQIPGPLIEVGQGSKIFIDFTNNIDQDTTIHWHGLRLDNAFDGVPEVTQKPVKQGKTFRYEVKFPDTGMYWYHPHIREDYQQELGLYGNILVVPAEEKKKFNKEEYLILDDIQINKDDVSSYSQDFATQALMGRFGNVMLVNGQTDYSLNANKGDVVRFYITNAANTRTFNLEIPNARIKVIGSDGGYYEKEFFTENIIISPSERYIVDVLFDDASSYEIKNTNPLKEYNLGNIEISQEQSDEDFSAEFSDAKENEEVKKEFLSFKNYMNKPPDVELVMDIKMAGMIQGEMMQNMDHSMHMGMLHAGEDGGIEWEDTMAMMNFGSTTDSVKWLLVDKKTGKANMDISYEWEKGDYVKIRLFNDPNSMHPMQHPIHFHGNRFVVLSKDEIANENMVWKDTVLVPKGETIDILLEVSNPGEWMVHCHIAEHLESGMMLSFNVKE